MGRARIWLVCSLAVIATILLADSAWAWGPATHLYYGMTVLSRLSDLTETVRTLLSSQTLPFLYGCVSADIVLAKKLGRAATHCHRWDNGIKLVDEAETPRTKAFSLGYVSHLAADTLSHNCYVPSKTLESYDSRVAKHIYWELRFDKKVTSKKTLSLFHEIAKGDYTDCDAHMERNVAMRIIDFSTSKRIFNQLLLLQGLHQWQKLWTGISEKAPWPLRDQEVQGYTDRSVNAMLSFLNERRDARIVQADPIGETRQRSAHELRRFYKQCLRENRAPAAKTVRAAIDRFALEPFHAIEIDEHKAA